MNRISVIQDIIRKKGKVTYLEIGVSYGNVLLKVDANRKIGIEPSPPKGSVIEDIANTKKFSLYRQTSNEFFQKNAKKVLTEGVDVVFVDGLHTYKQALQDVENSLKYLNPNGIIIMHDCNPLNSAIAFPIIKSFDEVLRLAKAGEIPGWNGCWNGDVWKALVHLRITHDDLDIFTLDLDWGLGIITKAKKKRKPRRICSLTKLQTAGYPLLERNRVEYLNLKPPKYFQNFISTL